MTCRIYQEKKFDPYAERGFWSKAVGRLNRKHIEPHGTTPYTGIRNADIPAGRQFLLPLCPKECLATLISDCYAPYFNVNVKGHQICTAHILRELTFLSELYDKHPWSEEMASLIREAIHLKKTTEGKIDDSDIEQRLQVLLNQTIDQTYKKMQTIQKRLIKYKGYLFMFLKNEWVPPDNNASERAIRVFKIKLKVSGFFKSNQGAQRFALLHSIADTARKNNNSPFGIFKLAAYC